ncbi:NFAT activation molecule 1 [Centroberyx affinis]|uniref:NFAT activation molecule 1 n=1 Tax=Centroberyx affinis TaxID=166261 RepID=UPI003A5B944D
METQGSCRRSSMSSWIFVVLILFVCCGIDAQEIRLGNRVWLALAGEDLHIDFVLVKPVNQSGDALKCFTPENKEIHRIPVSEMGANEEKRSVELKNVNSGDSGEYRCEYKTASAYWALLVKDEGYWEPSIMLEYKGIIVVCVFTFVLLVVSVLGSVYVFTGRWDNVTSNTDSGHTGRREREQNREDGREEGREEEVEEDNKDAVTTPSTSVYASLEPRPRSIYDVLDHSAANTEAAERRAKSKSEEPETTVIVEQTPHSHDEGVFESVYENF